MVAAISATAILQSNCTSMSLISNELVDEKGKKTRLGIKKRLSKSNMNVFKKEKIESHMFSVLS